MLVASVRRLPLFAGWRGPLLLSLPVVTAAPWAGCCGGPGNKRRPDADWKRLLSPDVYHVTRQGGTEWPHSGLYTDHFEPGVYSCACCHAPLFSSAAKFHSGCGWAAFSASLRVNSVVRRVDTSHGMSRVEVLCPQCDAHLGHVFPDGPAPTGDRFCINSVALSFTDKSGD